MSNSISSQFAVEAHSVVKRYGEKNAVDNVDFQIVKGQCFGILGPNGAGKSTTMKMIYGSVSLSAGELFVLGLNAKQNIREIKARIGVVPQEDGLDPDFSVLDNLLLFASYHRIPRNAAETKARELLRFMKLDEQWNSRVDSLSGGMKRRLAIARGLINNPSILILDEPTTGLDPQARIWIWERIKELKNQGTTLILTTHYMEEAEKLCDRLAIMDNGKIICNDSPQSLIKNIIGHEVVEFSCAPQDTDYLIGRVKSTYDYQVLQNGMRLFIKEGQDGKFAMSSIASENMTVRKSSLEDVFLKLTGHSLRD
jgi:lipooligosaccharide transport system ATP-binding protein